MAADGAVMLCKSTRSMYGHCPSACSARIACGIQHYPVEACRALQKDVAGAEAVSTGADVSQTPASIEHSGEGNFPQLEALEVSVHTHQY